MRAKRLLNGQVATALVAGAMGATLATAGIAVGGAVLSADGPGNAARVCVDANDGVQFHGTGACLAGETALDLAKPIPTGMADALVADSAKDEAAAEKVAKKVRKLKRSIGSSGNAAAQKLAFLNPAGPDLAGGRDDRGAVPEIPRNLELDHSERQGVAEPDSP